MSDTYHRVYQRIWLEPWEPDVRYLAFYLLTCEHRTFEGLYRLPLAYAAEDLGWTLVRVRNTMHSLVEHGFCEYDRQAQILWIVKALKAQSPNANQCRAAARKIVALPANTLLDSFLKVARQECPGLHEAVTERANGCLQDLVGPDSHPSESLQASKPPTTTNGLRVSSLPGRDTPGKAA